MVYKNVEKSGGERKEERLRENQSFSDPSES